MKDRFLVCMSCLLMMLGFVILLIVANGCVPKPRPKPNPIGSIGDREDIEDQYRRAVSIRVVCADEKSPTGMSFYSGSGAIYDRHLVITAFHVVGNRCEKPVVEITKYDASVAVVSRAWAIPYNDVAVLYTDTDMWDGPKAAIQPPGKGTMCFVPGMPTRMRRCGAFVHYDPEDPGKPLQFGALTVGGNSGSGIYDMGGSLVGIVTQGYKQVFLDMGLKGTWGMVLHPLMGELEL